MKGAYALALDTDCLATLRAKDAHVRNVFMCMT